MLIANDYSYSSYEVCTEEWPNKNLEKSYFIVANLILNYLLPLLIISACYICIWITVWQRSVPCETTNDTPTIEQQHNSCRLKYARKQIDQQSTASSSKSTKSLLLNTFSGFKNNLFPNSRLKHSSFDNVNNNLLINSNRNQSLIIKLKTNQQLDQLNDCALCINELETNGQPNLGKYSYRPRTSEDYQAIRDQLINDQFVKEKQQCYIINNRLEKKDKSSKKIKSY